MRNTNWLEKIGLVLVVIGVILLLTNSLAKNENFLKFTKYHEIFHWVGLGIWAVGYFIREKRVNKN